MVFRLLSLWKHLFENEGGDCPPLLCTGVASPQVLNCVQLRAPKYEKGIKPLESIQRGPQGW